ncbi:enoyl-CoA hydratase/isomerase family protein, partial [Serratia nevei]|uniref:enoyl-CoA hydratase/isomerase family protein n=1 Tax=Serratia nevei TaxID=2703794 RepID=UPI003FA6CDB2
INKLVHGVAYSPNESNTRITKPWIAVVDTFAIGGGMQMVLACDYVIGEQGCYVSLPAAKEGIIPGVSNLRLTTATSERFAKQVILHGRKVMADDADAGFIFDRVVASEELDQELEEAIALMAAPAVPANKRMLVLAKEPLKAFRTYMQAFCREQVVRMYALDVKEKTGKFSHKTPRAIIS